MGADWVNAYAAWVSAIGTWLASVVVVVSVFILRAQLQHTRRTIGSASAQASYALWVSVDQFFVDHPDLRPFIYEARSLNTSMDENLRWRIESALDMYVDSMANLFHQLPNFNNEEAEAYGNFLKERYQTQPPLKRFLDDNARWYPNSFVRFLRSEMKWLVNEAPAHRRIPQQSDAVNRKPPGSELV